MSENKKDWKERYFKNITENVDRKLNLDFKTPPPTKFDPEEWRSYRCQFGQYIDDLTLFGQLFLDLQYMDLLIETFKKEEDIINTFINSFDLNLPQSYALRYKKKQRTTTYANNLYLATTQLKETRKEFFIIARIPISTLYDQDITPIINKFKSRNNS
ncbi:hypothetical protein F8M41_006187 [Gigaspora margarita]|uniref:Uncharacterized protein n=1 Tax=Gigaspora margarita TaxID=4874 RepID=A0A8H3X6W4_GIGMA|nr:hypothetical protein F8M41_006187 [Gigaspora margarita]